MGANNHQKKEVSQPIGGILALVSQSNTASSGQLKVVLFSAVKSQWENLELQMEEKEGVVEDWIPFYLPPPTPLGG